MRTRHILCGLCLLVGISGGLRGEVIRLPLVGAVLRPEGITEGPVWFTETRIWNPTGEEASVQITGAIGRGNPTRTSFRVPAGGVLDLPFYDFFDLSERPDLFATLELVSDRPVKVLTTVNVSTLPTCVGPFPPARRPHWAGSCDTIGGPILQSFGEYIPVGARVGLTWLTAERLFYRDNLYITNPSTEQLVLTGTFRSYDGRTSRMKSFIVPARSMLTVYDVFADPALQAIEDANREADPDQGAASAELIGNQPFYAFAVVINQSLSGHTSNRFAIVQPEPLP